MEGLSSKLLWQLTLLSIFLYLPLYLWNEDRHWFLDWSCESDNWLFVYSVSFGTFLGALILYGSVEFLFMHIIGKV